MLDGPDLAGFRCDYLSSFEEVQGWSAGWELCEPETPFDRLRSVMRFGLGSKTRFFRAESIEPTGVPVEIDSRQWQRFVVSTR